MSDLIEHLTALAIMSPSGATRLDLHHRQLIRQAADELSRLQSLSDQNRLTGGWRDIESAPRDGTPLMAFQRGEVFKCWWHDDWPGDESGWQDSADTQPNPTHWQPLPSPPLPLPGGEEKR